MNAKVPMARLDRLLANLGYGSRREVSGLVARGQVMLDGVTLKDAGARLDIHRRGIDLTTVPPVHWDLTDVIKGLDA